MRVWFQRGFAMLLIMAVAVAGNLHLPLVQAVAWARMYAQYRQVYTAEASLSITFSGQYPCKLCKLVAGAEKERNNMNGVAASGSNLLLPLPQPSGWVAKPAEIACWSWREPAALLPSEMSRPAVPPPRWA